MSKSAKAVPPQPLEERLPPSVRHPEGLARCQRWKMREGKFWQCSKAARRGVRTCGVHGAGFPAREKQGIRDNPATAALRTGERAKPETIATFFEGDSTIARRFNEYLDGPHLMDLQPVIATARAIYDTYIERMDGRGGEDAQSTLAAIQGADTIARLVQRFVDIDQRLGEITHAEVERFKHAFVQTLLEFLGPARADEALVFMHEFLRDRRGQPMPWRQPSRDAAGLPKPRSARTW